MWFLPCLFFDMTAWEGIHLFDFGTLSCVREPVRKTGSRNKPKSGRADTTVREGGGGFGSTYWLSCPGGAGPYGPVEPELRPAARDGQCVERPDPVAPHRVPGAL